VTGKDLVRRDFGRSPSPTTSGRRVVMWSSIGVILGSRDYGSRGGLASEDRAACITYGVVSHLVGSRKSEARPSGARAEPR
jgi:hypothetical protein